MRLTSSRRLRRRYGSQFTTCSAVRTLIESTKSQASERLICSGWESTWTSTCSINFPCSEVCWGLWRKCRWWVTMPSPRKTPSSCKRYLKWGQTSCVIGTGRLLPSTKWSLSSIRTQTIQKRTCRVWWSYMDQMFTTNLLRIQNARAAEPWPHRDALSASRSGIVQGNANWNNGNSTKPSAKFTPRWGKKTRSMTSKSSNKIKRKLKPKRNRRGHWSKNWIDYIKEH